MKSPLIDIEKKINSLIQEVSKLDLRPVKIRLVCFMEILILRTDPNSISYPELDEKLFSQFEDGAFAPLVYHTLHSQVDYGICSHI